MRDISMFRIRSLALALSAMTVSPLALSTGMVPETSVVLVNEADGEATMNVKNSESSPQLLYTSINHIEEDKEDLVVVTPPVTRVEGNDTQVVRFILRNKTPLKTERLARAVFEGIPPKDDKAGGARDDDRAPGSSAGDSSQGSADRARALEAIADQRERR